MIALFIDESGSFECKDKKAETLNGKVPREVVGGVICYDVKGENGLKIINEKVKREFISVCGKDYYSKIHGKDRVGKFQNKMLERIFNTSSALKLLPFWIDRGEVTRYINSNITDDNTASMLYYNMLNTLISNVLFNYSGIIRDNNTEEVLIFLPSRVAPVGFLDSKKIEEFKTIGIPMEETENKSFKMESSATVLMHLNNELCSRTYLKNKINIKIYQQSIKYKEEAGEFNELFQLSDFVCNNAYWKVMELDGSIVFAYDDINESYRRIYRNYKENNLFGFIEEKFYYETNFKSNAFRKYYDEYLKAINEKEIISPRNLEECMIKIDAIVDSKEYQRRRIRYYLDFIYPHIKELSSRYAYLKFKYYYIKISVNNHFGDYSGNLDLYREAMEIANSIPSIEAPEFKFKLNKLYAVTCSNGFEFENALNTINDLIDIQSDIDKLLRECNSLIFDSNDNQKEKTNVEIGKLLSSKGQYLSFMRRDGAREALYEAISYMGDDTKNRNQTISYLVHQLADSKDKITEKDMKLVNEYLGYTDFMEGVEYFINLKDEDIIRVSESFKLYGFLKLYINRMPDRVEENSLKRLAKKIIKLREVQRKKSMDLEHPWQLIMFTLGRYLDDEQELKNSLLRTAYSMSMNPENNTTIRIIGYMIKVYNEQSKKSVKDFIDFLKEGYVSEYMREYFEISYLEDDSVDQQDKISKIISKFTFMYC